MLVEILEDLYAFPFRHDGVVDGVVGHQFEVLEGPVETDSRCEIVHSCILISEFARIVRTDAHCIAESEQDGC